MDLDGRSDHRGAQCAIGALCALPPSVVHTPTLRRHLRGTGIGTTPGGTFPMRRGGRR
jgi:hypothetical protein